MPDGYILDTSYVPLEGLIPRTTDRSAQLFIKGMRTPEEDVGYVWPYDRGFQAYLFNGSDTPCEITDLVKTNVIGIFDSGATSHQTILSKGSVKLIFQVELIGPGIIDATYQYISDCEFSPTLTIVGTRRVLVDGIPQPRPINMTDAMAEAYAYADPIDTFYDTLEFASTGEANKVLVVHSDESLETPQGTFLPCRFSFELPETQASVRGEMKISVDFLPRDAQIWIREQTQRGGSVTVVWRQYLGPNQEPDAWYPMPLEVSHVEQTPLGATATALFPDLVGMPFPKRIMTTTELPGGIV